MGWWDTNHQVEAILGAGEGSIQNSKQVTYRWTAESFLSWALPVFYIPRQMTSDSYSKFCILLST